MVHEGGRLRVVRPSRVSWCLSGKGWNGDFFRAGAGSARDGGDLSGRWLWCFRGSGIGRYDATGFRNHRPCLGCAM